MSRANQRRAQNAASLIRPSAVVKLCQHDRCGAYAMACYDGELNHVGDFCPKHRKLLGYCLQCGNLLTQAERDDPQARGFCAAETNRNKYGLRSQGGWDEHDFDDDDDDECFDCDDDDLFD